MIIAFTGKMGAGKSTAATIARELLWARGQMVRVLKFADPLYEIQNFIYQKAGIISTGKDRKLLQWIGTDWGRSIHENIWVNIFDRDVRFIYENCSPTRMAILNDDLRFNNEAAYLKQSVGNFIVKVEGPQRTDTERAGHESEAGIEERYVDFVLRNDSTIEDLTEQMREMLKRI